MAAESAVMAVIRASRPSFRNPHDKVAFAVHASFFPAGFFLTATGENASTDSPPISMKEVGIKGWNKLKGIYSFVYFKTEKVHVLVNCTVMAAFLTISALNLEGEQKEPFILQVKVNDYVSDVDDVKLVNHYGKLYKDMKGLVKKLNSDILAKLEPKVGSRQPQQPGIPKKAHCHRK